MAVAVEDSLANVLRSAGVAKEVDDHLVAIKCTRLVQFANWADSKAECAKFVAGSQWEKEPAELALIKTRMAPSQHRSRPPAQAPFRRIR